MKFDYRRIGNIKVYHKCLEQFWGIIDNFIVLEARTDEYKTITYTGRHKQFKRLKIGDKIPLYELIVDFDDKKRKYTYELVQNGIE